MASSENRYELSEMQRAVLRDPAEEILANKLTALVGRQEERDLVDVLRLEEAGYRLEGALGAALEKDGSCTPATLAWLLSQIQIPDDAVLPGNTTTEELRSYVAKLVVRLRRLSAPASSPPLADSGTSVTTPRPRRVPECAA